MRANPNGVRRAALILALLAGSPAAALPDCPAGKGPLIAAHRARLDASRAENSLKQMRTTAAVAPYMLEIDLSLTHDGAIVLMHDDLVDRTTDGKGPLAALDAKTVAGLRLKDSPDEAPPPFEAVARWAGRTSNVQLMLDIKAVPPAKVAPVVAKHGLRKRVLVLTFDRSTAGAAREADADWLVSVLVRSQDDLRAYRTLFGARRFVAYVPTTSDPTLFALTKQTGAIVLTDAMSGGDAAPDALAAKEGVAAYRRYLADRPVDILVTDHAERLPACAALR